MKIKLDMFPAASLIIWACLTFAAFRFVLRPLIYLIKMKIRHGNKIRCIFYPFIGISFNYITGIKFKGHPFHYYRKLKKSNPEVEAVAAGGFVYNELLLLSPVLIKEIMVNKISEFEKVDYLPFVDNLLDRGLLFTDGEKWKQQRKLMSPQFTFESLKNKFHVIKGVTDHFLGSMLDDVKLREDFRMCRFFMQISGEVVLSSFFGKQI